MSKKVTPLSEGALVALAALKDGTATVADLKANGIVTNASHFGALIKRGLVTADKVEIEVVAVSKRKVNAYTITDAGLAELA